MEPQSSSKSHYDRPHRQAKCVQSPTSNAARFLGTTAGSGIVSLGKSADLVLLDANPLYDVDSVFRQDGVMLRGRWFPKAELEAALSKAVSTENSVKR
jgi:adenine deaminase